MASIVKIKDSSGEVQYPITKPEAVIDENGKNVLQLIQENGSSYDDTEIRNELERLENVKADKTQLTELSEEIGKKQDTITDLETIRSGAAKGATALQSVPDTYATKTDVSNAIQSAITNELNADF